jgi:carboxypeptidase family protein
MRQLRRIAVMVSCLVVLPVSAYAQATLAGTVKDSSGGVLPGVTVEAASPVLIEKTRSAVTDGTGQYRLEALLPGTYTVTFTLSGFATLRREGVEVTGSGVTTINADMRVGAVTETVLVTAETPVVDIQTTRRQEVLTADTVASVPATRGYNAILAMIPSVNTSAFFNAGEQNNTQLSPGMTIFTSHGGRGNEGRVQVDSLNVGAAFNGGGVSGYIMDTAGAQELQFTLSGGLGEAETGGINLNIVPKTGGNRFAGQFFASTAGSWSQSNNVDASLEAVGITEAGLIDNWDLNGSVGGPIKRDRLWFYANVRDFGTYRIVPAAFANLNAGDASKWNYVEDRSQQIRNDTGTTLGSIRLTAQVTPRNKVGFFIDQQRQCTGSALASGSAGEGWCRDRDVEWVALGGLFTSPEADAIAANRSPQRVTQATWTSPVTSKLLLEAGFSSYISRWGWMETPGSLTNLTPVTTIVPVFKTFRGLDNFFYNHQSANVWRASLAYVTGAHSSKVGYQGAYHIEDIDDRMNTTGLTYTDLSFLDIIPGARTMSLTQRIAPWEISNRTAYHSFYGQDQWTLGRMTLQGAVRYDHAYSFYPAEHNGSPVPSPWNPTPISFPRSDGVKGYNDITPRVGVAYDLFANGRTSVKVNVGKYLEAANNQGNYQINNPASDGRNGRFEGSRFQVQTSRTWFDLNNNYIAECDLMNPGANAGLDICAPWDNQQFGSTKGLTTINQAILEGWGVRPWDWQIGASVQQEIFPRVTVEVGYHRRWFGNFFVNDNRAVGPNDFDRFTLTAPVNSKLPDGGGYPAGYYDVKPEKFGQVANYYTFETDYAPARTTYWHGVDVNITGRLRNGLTFQGGTSSGRGVRDTCALWAALPELIAPFSAPFGFPQKQQIDACHVDEPVLTQVRGLATYEVPKAEVQLGLSFRSVPGTFTSLTNAGTTGSNGFSLNAMYTPTFPEFLASLGRLQSNPQAQYNLLLPGQMYTPRLTYIDFRAAKLVRWGRTRTMVGFDLYNLFNSNTATALDQNYGANFMNPTAIQDGRLARFNVTVDF